MDSFQRTNVYTFIGGVVGLVLASSIVTFIMVLPILLVGGWCGWVRWLRGCQAVAALHVI